MKNKSLLIITYIITTLFIASCSGFIKNLTSSTPTEEDILIIEKNWATAQKIADYDYYSWVASDSLLLNKHKIKDNLIMGWVVIFENNETRVLFGNNIENSFYKYFEVKFTGNDISCFTYETGKKDSSKAYELFWAIGKAKKINENIITKSKVSYNSYAFESSDSTFVYFSPGSNNDNLILCGGIKTVFKKQELLLNKKLHYSPVEFSDIPNNAVLYRTSSMNKLINEIDIAQFLIFKDWIPKQIITTRKFTFSLTYDKESGKVTYDF